MAPAHLEQRSDKAKNTSLRTIDKDNMAWQSRSADRTRTWW